MALSGLKDNIENIIFDLDGTLWDPMPMSIKAWHTALNGFDCITNPISKEDIQGILGMQHDLVGQHLFPYLSKEQQDEVMSSCYLQEVNYIKESGCVLYHGLEETLKILGSKYDLYIVSNCQAGYIEAFYEYHGLGAYFKDFECSGNTGKSKTENVKMVIARNTLSKPIYIGDTMGDYTAAEGNRIPFVYAQYGFGEVPKAEYTIDTIEDLRDLL
ncbi:HAD family hydrolase [Arenibacter sp. BSSL-BM3]|uniref:phosphoglycolate phosphatase n=1 Tax=Arenibacter arenosicollis TaxID=2762274 RepID=A0ABR7QHX4_9FLAO|nr:HAD family hydrolase [Arenibacter arenosicollis]MBC8766801.1 HAD family hydrolase [Arenibacter arenosicollis]